MSLFQIPLDCGEQIVDCKSQEKDDTTDFKTVILFFHELNRYIMLEKKGALPYTFRTAEFFEKSYR